jgi:hypothetical protein
MRDPQTGRFVRGEPKREKPILTVAVQIILGFVLGLSAGVCACVIVLHFLPGPHK